MVLFISACTIDVYQGGGQFQYWIALIEKPPAEYICGDLPLAFLCSSSFHGAVLLKIIREIRLLSKIKN
jgi:hypothetical protein